MMWSWRIRSIEHFEGALYHFRFHLGIIDGWCGSWAKGPIPGGAALVAPVV